MICLQRQQEHGCYLVTPFHLAYVFIEKANFPSFPPYGISSHKRCYAQKHTQSSCQVGVLNIPPSIQCVLLSPLLWFTPYG